MVYQQEPTVTGTARWVLPVVLALTLLAFTLRLVNLDAFSFWTDEGLTPLRSGYSVPAILSNQILIQEAVSQDTHPPFYYLLVHLTRKLWGETDFAFRYPSLLTGVLLVPLLFQFGRRLGGTGAGLFAALFTAVNPLQVYYGNEARMYTLLVLLGAGASYVLWRALSGADLRRTLPLYLLLVGLALYTHYTAIFLIAGQALFWIGLLWQKGYRKLLIGLGIAAILLAVPLMPYTVPRLFTGAEANYYYVPPLTMFSDVWRFFSLGLSVHYREPLVTAIVLVTAVLSLVGLWAAKTWLRRGFLLVYLLAVVFGLMAGSLIKPMYQGVRHIMLGSPALLLLLGLGADYLLGMRMTEQRNGRLLWRAATFFLILTPLLGALYALDNLYNDPAFVKDDLRAMIAYVERRAGDNDVVLYNNAVLLPLHAHYQQRADLPVTALPVYPYMAEGVEEQLAALGQEYERIWFVTDPPADGRDAERRVAAWLEQHLQDIDNQSFPARTTVISSAGYRTATAHLPDLPPDSTPVAAAWPGLPDISGVKTGFAQPAAGATLWFDLFWRGDQAPPLDSNLRLWLAGSDGQAWALYEQALSDDFGNWPAPGLVRETYRLPLPLGLPPGDYTLMAEPLDADGRSLGAPQALTEVALAASDVPNGRPAIAFDNGLVLQGIEWGDDDVRPGHNLPLSLIWGANDAGAAAWPGARYELQVVGADGALLRAQGGRPGPEGLAALPTDTAVREPTAIYFPPETAPGLYRLRWRMTQDEQPVGGISGWLPWSRTDVPYGMVTVTPWPMETAVPAAMIRSGAEFGDEIALAGYTLDSLPQELDLALFWQSRQATAENYVVFVHIVDQASGSIAAQVDRVPLDGLRPTAGWRTGEVLNDAYTIALPADLPEGDYQINVGLYNSDTGQRLPVLLNGQPQAADQLPLAAFTRP